MLAYDTDRVSKSKRDAYTGAAALMVYGQYNYKYFYTQKFSNRALVVRPAEMKYWEQLRLEYMTEESDDSSDPTVIIEHRSKWRSPRK